MRRVEVYRWVNWIKFGWKYRSFLRVAPRWHKRGIVASLDFQKTPRPWNVLYFLSIITKNKVKYKLLIQFYFKWQIKNKSSTRIASLMIIKFDDDVLRPNHLAKEYFAYQPKKKILKASVLVTILFAFIYGFILYQSNYIE